MFEPIFEWAGNRTLELAPRPSSSVSPERRSELRFRFLSSEEGGGVLSQSLGHVWA